MRDDPAFQGDGMNTNDFVNHYDVKEKYDLTTLSARNWIIKAEVGIISGVTWYSVKKLTELVTEGKLKEAL